MLGPGGGKGSGKGESEEAVQPGRLPVRGGSEASERWKGVAGLGEVVRRGPSRKKELRLLPEEAWA